MKKSFFLLFLAIFFCPASKAQTTISPKIGIDFLKMPIAAYYSYYYGEEQPAKDNFFVRSPIVGLSVEHRLFNKLGLSLGLDYTVKKLAVTPVAGIVPYNGLSFNHWRKKVGLSFYLWEKIRLGADMNFCTTNTINILRSGKKLHKFKGKIVKKAVSFSVGYRWKNFQADFYYAKMQKNVWFLRDQHIAEEFNRLDDALGFTLSYNFQVLKKREKSDVNCPKF